MSSLDLLQEILTKYGTAIWLSFVTFVITTFVMKLMKDFVLDLVNYFKVRMSDLGYGAMILWDGKLKRVVDIKFKKIKVVDEDEIMFIPINKWMEEVQIYPQPTTECFDEDKIKTKDKNVMNGYNGDK